MPDRIGTKERPIHILLVEDDRGNQVLTKRALASGPLECVLHIVDDGEKALDYLHRRGPYANPDESPRPDLILLDLNLPRKDGRQVLREIRADEGLKRIVVVVLTTSRLDDDILKTYASGANSFITKPVRAQEFMAVVQELETYWFRTVTLPTEGD